VSSCWCDVTAAVIGLQLQSRLERGIQEPSMGRVEVNAALAAIEGDVPMSDLNKAVRDTEADVKENWRKADGNESLEDKARDLGDRATNAVKDVGDKVHEEADRMSRDASYEQGRVDEMNRSR
jgi:hypothetical protein